MSGKLKYIVRGAIIAVSAIVGFSCLILVGAFYTAFMVQLIVYLCNLIGWCNDAGLCTY